MCAPYRRSSVPQRSRHRQVGRSRCSAPAAALAPSLGVHGLRCRTYRRCWLNRCSRSRRGHYAAPSRGPDGRYPQIDIRSDTMSPPSTVDDWLIADVLTKLNLLISNEAVDCTQVVRATPEDAGAAPWLTCRREPRQFFPGISQTDAAGTPMTFLGRLGRNPDCWLIGRAARTFGP